MAIQVTLTKRDMWNLAQPIMNDMRQRLGEDFLKGRSSELEIGLAKDGNPYVVTDELWFFHSPDNGELTAARRGDDGSTRNACRRRLRQERSDGEKPS